MNRTIEDIQKDIELLGIKGGYDVEQLLTPQDCRRLSYEIERLKELCDKYEEEHKTTFEIWQKDIKENEHLRTALNSKENIIKEVREYIKEKYIEDYSNNDNYIPLEKLNLKNCSWERSLQVLEILDKGE